VQRRRADLAHYLEEDTPFPARKDKEATYRLGGSYRKLFDRALDHARETIGDDTGGKHRQRVRWWSALALLRALASSPRAAAETLRARSVTAATTDAEAADELGRRTVLDAETDEESPDTAPGADPGDVETVPERLRRLAKDAEKLEGNEDKKLGKAIEEIWSLLGDGYSPIVFCRFIATAEYVAENLRKRLKNVAVEPVTGRIPPADREERVEDLASNPRRVLVCTDCLSEGINLQEHFDAVMHYDLSWNPTRHEQREGRVDRYGQNRDEVRILTYYGVDNRIDGIVLDVLLRKQNTIRTSTGVSIPVPANTEDVVEALMEGLLLRGGDEAQQYFEGFDPIRQKLHASWEEAADREKRSRTLFAQRAIDPEVVRRELDEARAASGAPEDVRRFVKTALAAHGAGIEERNGCVRVRLQDADPELRDTLQLTGELDVVFEPPVPEGTLYLPRTAPLVESLASHVLETALESGASGVARRAGVARTRAVGKRTTLLLLRLRYEIHERRSARPNLLAEESRILAFEGAPGAARWLDDREIEPLLLAAPDANIAPEQAREFVEEVVAGLPTLEERLESLAHERSEALADAHGRVREATRRRARHSVEPRLPVDLLGIYVYLPVRS